MFLLRLIVLFFIRGGKTFDVSQMIDNINDLNTKVARLEDRISVLETRLV